jgi:hypothetical protein
MAKRKADLFFRREGIRHIAHTFGEFDIVDSRATVPLYEFYVPGNAVL